MNNITNYQPPLKPLIIAICGKSASGKDTLVHWLSSMLKAINISTNIIISDTTRPPRLHEEDGVNYNFITEKEFYNKINDEKYFEYSCFNGWFYGTAHSAIDYNNINIGIFNVEGISNIAAYQNKYEILCVYLKCDIYHRIKRSIEREGHLKKEHIRRIFADNTDFKDINNTLRRFSNYFIFDSTKMSSSEMVDHITWRLKNKKLYNFT